MSKDEYHYWKKRYKELEATGIAVRLKDAVSSDILKAELADMSQVAAQYKADLGQYKEALSELEVEQEELEAERDALRKANARAYGIAGKMQEEIDTLKADNERLREAAQKVVEWKECIEMLAPELGGALKQIYALGGTLAATPAQSLAEYRKRVLEEAAKMVENWENHYREHPPRSLAGDNETIAGQFCNCAQAIRNIEEVMPSARRGLENPPNSPDG